MNKYLLNEKKKKNTILIILGKYYNMGNFSITMTFLLMKSLFSVSYGSMH